jgi:DNA-binding transcriptional LysR family regulator
VELRHLRYFIAVAEELNFSRAAQRLHVSQPPLSRQIRDLEAELKLPLFERDRQGVELTPAGRTLLSRARRLVRAAELLRLEAQQLNARRPEELHVGYRPSPTGMIIADVLGRYHALASGMRITLHEMVHREMIAQVRSRRLHAALTIRPARAEIRNLRFDSIRQHRAGIICAHSHPFAGKSMVEPSAVRRLPMVTYRQGDFAEYRAWVLRVLNVAPDKLRVEQECDGVLSVIAAVESGRGIAVVGDFVTATAGSRVRYIPFTQTRHALDVGLVYRPTPPLGASLARLVEAGRACRRSTPHFAL